MDNSDSTNISMGEAMSNALQTIGNNNGPNEILGNIKQIATCFSYILLF